MLFSSYNSVLCCLETDLKNESTLLLVCVFQAIYGRDPVLLFLISKAPHNLLTRL